MRTLRDPKELPEPLVTVLCFTHGDEVFGKVIWDYLKKHKAEYPGLQAVFCNERAYRAKKRFVESNLNRIYPGDPNGDYEHRLAHEILKITSQSRYVLDIHNTHTSLTLAPIITKYNRDIRRILSFTRQRHVARMPHSRKNCSTIDLVPAGVGLEFSYRYAETPEALEDFVRVIDGLYGRVKPVASEKIIMHIDGSISMDVAMPDVVENFKYYDVLDGYTFLVGENSYKEEGHQGFYAKRIEEVLI